MKISLIHPSRCRAEKSGMTTFMWLQMYSKELRESVKAFKVANPDNALVATVADDVELIVSIDSDDPELSNYQYRYSGIATKVLVNDNKCVVEATNLAAKEATGDILIYLSDDFFPPDDWGQLILKEFEDATGPRLLKVDDMLQKFHVPVLTIPIMNRALYERLGYFWHPEYKSMFVDEDLYWTATKLNALKMCPHLKFPHEHVSIGKAAMDETYRRSSANWDQGKAVFAKRKAAGFPV